MKVLEVKCLSEMMRVTNEWSAPEEMGRGAYCYRGQSDKGWGLVPTVFRHLAQKDGETLFKKYKDSDGKKHEYVEILKSKIPQKDIESATDFEIRIYEQVRERARAYKHDAVNWDNPWERLCLAQHYGVPTRLLDWTSNVLVAAFFAVEDVDEPEDGVIWCFNIAKFLDEDPKHFLVARGQPLDSLPKQNVTFLPETRSEQPPQNVKERKAENQLWLIQPPDIDDRMRLQSGFFTIYITVGETKEDDFVWSHSQWFADKKLLRILRIPGANKRAFRDQLWSMGITRNTLFPGLSGLGQHLTALQKEWLR